MKDTGYCQSCSYKMAQRECLWSIQKYTQGSVIAHQRSRRWYGFDPRLVWYLLWTEWYWGRGFPEPFVIAPTTSRMCISGSVEFRCWRRRWMTRLKRFSRKALFWSHSFYVNMVLILDGCMYSGFWNGSDGTACLNINVISFLYVLTL
jgi:hypothetical protein